MPDKSIIRFANRQGLELIAAALLASTDSPETQANLCIALARIAKDNCTHLVVNVATNVTDACLSQWKEASRLSARGLCTPLYNKCRHIYRIPSCK